MSLYAAPPVGPEERWRVSAPRSPSCLGELHILRDVGCGQQRLGELSETSLSTASFSEYSGEPNGGGTWSDRFRRSSFLAHRSLRWNWWSLAQGTNRCCSTSST